MDAHGYSRYSMRGYGIVSRTCSSPQIQVDHALDAHAEAAVRHRAVAAQVEVPLERLLRQLVLLDALQQQVEIVEALAAADDLAVAFGREHVDAQRLVGLLRVGLHVERLHRGRVVRDADRAVELLRQHGLVGAAEVGAVLERLALVDAGASPPRRR